MAYSVEKTLSVTWVDDKLLLKCHRPRFEHPTSWTATPQPWVNSPILETVRPNGQWKTTREVLTKNVFKICQYFQILQNEQPSLLLYKLWELHDKTNNFTTGSTPLRANIVHLNLNHNSPIDLLITGLKTTVCT